MSRIETSLNQMVSLRDRGFRSIRQSIQNPETRWIILFIVFGCLLRLLWAEDMKWKEDEIWMYQTARSVLEGRSPWPWLGMSNGVGFLNPGLSVWCFIALAWVSENPVTMVRWVMVSNIVAIVLFAEFIRRYVDESETKSVLIDYFWAGGVIMPLLLLIARVRVPGHYLIVLYPFIQIWAAWLERGRGRSLILISTAQLFLSVCFLSFIHTNNGNSNWPHGLVYHLHPLQNP